MKLSYISCEKKSMVLRKISLCCEGGCCNKQLRIEIFFVKAGASKSILKIHVMGLLTQDINLEKDSLALMGRIDLRKDHASDHSMGSMIACKFVATVLPESARSAKMVEDLNYMNKDCSFDGILLHMFNATALSSFVSILQMRNYNNLSSRWN
ncbi:hypothetical protein C5167_007580 [Papaver somniferum]|nr:hypothetical protein C5167_007580 [Papaver somniferum]